MLSEFRVRELMFLLKDNLSKEKNVVKAMAFSGGISALEMVLEDGD